MFAASYSAGPPQKLMRKVKWNCGSSMPSRTLVNSRAGFPSSLLPGVHADALANVIVLASGLETGTARHLAETVPREIESGHILRWQACPTAIAKGSSVRP